MSSNPYIEKEVKFAKSSNKKILFYIDFLIFDTKYTNLLSYIKNLKLEKKAQYDNYVIDALANELIIFPIFSFIVMLNLGENDLIKKFNKVNSDNIIIGYYSANSIS